METNQIDSMDTALEVATRRVNDARVNLAAVALAVVDVHTRGDHVSGRLLDTLAEAGRLYRATVRAHGQAWDRLRAANGVAS